MNNLEHLEEHQSVTNINLSIDVIIPVYKPDETFRKSIERLVKQSIKPKKIILLHTEESTNTSEEIEQKDRADELLSYALELSTKECQVICIDIMKEDFDHGGTRNYGASISDTEFIMFMTQDAVPAHKNLIKNLMKSFENDKVAAAYGRQLVNNKAGEIEKYTRDFNYPATSCVKSQQDLEELGIKTYFCSNVCAAYRKTVYDEMGGFVLKTIFNEDMIMAAGIINAGYSIAYAADAKVIHSHRYTYMQQFQRNFDLAVSQQQYHDIFDAVKSENEGIKLVRQTLDYLLKEQKYWLIPDLIFQSGFKFLGYKAGKKYEIMPSWLLQKLSMNPSYWK